MAFELTVVTMRAKEYLGDLEEVVAPEVDISAWEQQRENWERFVRMDTVMPLVQKRFDEKGSCPKRSYVCSYTETDTLLRVFSVGTQLPGMI